MSWEYTESESPPSPDCNLSDEDFQTKHTYYTNAPHADAPELSPPVLISSAEPQYPAEARAAKVGGTVIVGTTVDITGVPQKLLVVKSRGVALDQAALDSVGQYRFEPAHDAKGTPVAMRIDVEVNFQIC